MHARMFATVLALGLALGSAHAAEDGGGAFPFSKQDAERLRDAGENACREMMDSAQQLGEKFRIMGLEMSRLMSKAGEELAREMAPAMRDLAERLDEMAREFEQRERREPEVI